MKSLRIKIFSDGANLTDMIKMVQNPLVKGFTTNPTLMRKSGVKDYQSFAQAVLKDILLPVSFEGFADDNTTMLTQARKIAKWGHNVNVKIPITNTSGVSTEKVIKELSNEGITVNVTAVFTLGQVRAILSALNPDAPAIISIFAGRIADTGVDPLAHMRAAKRMMIGSKVELLWASTRELFNVFQADEVGCDIITVPPEFLFKLESLMGKDLIQYSLETVRMFHRDAQEAGYALP